MTGAFARIRTSLTPVPGAARTSTMCIRRAVARVSMEPSTATGTDRIDLMRRPESGFTVIELLIVVTLVVILASMGMVQYQTSVQRSREPVLKEDLFRMRDVIDQYYADKTSYPAGLQDLVSSGYIREIPEDPMTH